MAGPADDVLGRARSLARAAVETLDIGSHDGAHPRFGVLDVVPFVPLNEPAKERSDLRDAVAARDAFAAWAGTTLGLPCFLYGPLPGGGARSLPEVRRGAFGAFGPDWGPTSPHPTAGAAAVGARPLLVAYNLWLTGADIELARAVARALRGPLVRALAFDLAPGVQVSFNLLDPIALGPAEIYDRAASLLGEGRIVRAELVGLIPAAALELVPKARWGKLDLAPDRTIEARLAGAGRLR
jgi:glutamate formiminotransferase